MRDARMCGTTKAVRFRSSEANHAERPALSFSSHKSSLAFERAHALGRIPIKWPPLSGRLPVWPDGPRSFARLRPGSR
jgi:hypothetical protein